MRIFKTDNENENNASYDESALWMREYQNESDDAVMIRDMDFMKRLYPSMSQELLSYVEEECDKMEFEGSPMFAEFPDRVFVDQMVANVYGMASYLENMFQPMMEENEGIRATSHCVSCRGQDNWMENLISVILFNEMSRRRHRHRNYRRGRRPW